MAVEPPRYIQPRSWNLKRIAIESFSPLDALYSSRRVFSQPIGLDRERGFMNKTVIFQIAAFALRPRSLAKSRCCVPWAIYIQYIGNHREPEVRNLKKEGEKLREVYTAHEMWSRRDKEKRKRKLKWRKPKGRGKEKSGDKPRDLIDNFHLASIPVRTDFSLYI